MEALYQNEIRLPGFLCGLNNEGSPLTAANLFQEVARSHALQIGVGVEDLHKSGQLWVLSRVRYAFHEVFAYGMPLTLKTWPKGFHGFYALRDFEMLHKEKVLVSATSAWLVISAKTQKLIRLENPPAAFSELADQHAIQKLLEKLPFTKEVPRPTRTVTFTDLDVNGHVNNAQLVGWIVDSFPIAFLEKNAFSTLEINYIKEIRPEEDISIYHSHPQEDQTILVSGYRGEKLVFTASATFKSISER